MFFGLSSFPNITNVLLINTGGNPKVIFKLNVLKSGILVLNRKKKKRTGRSI